MQPAVFDHPPFEDHELIDSGEGEKLERFGDVTLVRPDPQALWSRRRPDAWPGADLVFVRESDRGGRWEVRRGAPAFLSGGDRRWEVRFEGARLVVEPTPFKHVGLFPEQAANWVWTREVAGALDPHPRLLNLFAHTGAASILAVQAGYEVTHVDASRTSIARARENARASGLSSSALRIVLDDALAFARRETRRDARYAGILIDPPHYGRGPRGEKWELERGIAPLLAACAKLLAERSFLVLSTYAIGTSPLALANLVGELEGGVVEAGELALPESAPDESPPRRLPCGFCVRWTRGLEAG